MTSNIFTCTYLYTIYVHIKCTVKQNDGETEAYMKNCEGGPVKRIETVIQRIKTYFRGQRQSDRPTDSHTFIKKKQIRRHAE